tara:strand:- start:112631 stop:113560 length:930 start_codon:yes stop_codon:yes gene_type:complete
MNNEDLLKKWLSDELSEAELNDFKELEDFNLNAKVIQGAQQFKAANFSKVKSFEEFKANLPTKDIEKESTPVIKLNSYKLLYRIAAIFILGLGMYSFYLFNNSVTTVETLASQKSTFALPDASSVTLNADSKIAFNERKWEKKRALTLEGEAYFKVAKGSKFDVNTPSGTVSVLGTQFTVNQRTNYFEVKCYEGIVSVTSNGRIKRLTKGKTIRIANGTVTTDTTINTSPEWINNITSFKSVSLNEVLNELERQYDVIIETESIDTKQLFTGGFVHDNLDQALISITTPLQLSYKKDISNKIILSKEKV